MANVLVSATSRLTLTEPTHPSSSSVQSYRSTSSVTSSKSAYIACQQAAALGDAKIAAGQPVEDSDTITLTETRKSPDATTSSTHRYLRRKMLGKGGFAKVYGCMSEDSGKEYAVKIVEKKNLVKSRARQKLQAEIKIHRLLKHKRVVEYKHFFEDRANCYILLELCPNASMNELIKRRKRLTEPEVLYYMKQLLEGTKYMHTNNIIHRDLKLGNLFLDRQMGIKIGDLGLATKLSHSNERKRTICGTPNYIAPEIIDNKGGTAGSGGHSFEVDIWSMGVIMYTLLVGKPPYEAKDVKSTYKRILANIYSFPDTVSVSQRAKDLIARMLQSKPEMRPTLDEVLGAPFFRDDDVRIPLVMPQFCTQIAPVWSLNAAGDEIVVVNTPEERRSSSSENNDRGRSIAAPVNSENNVIGKIFADGKQPTAAQSSKRQPLKETSTNANNGNGGGTEGGRGKGSLKAGADENAPPMKSVATRSSARLSNTNTNTNTNSNTADATAAAAATGKWAFKIYDEANDKDKDGPSSQRPTTSSSAKASSDDIATLTAKAAACIVSIKAAAAAVEDSTSLAVTTTTTTSRKETPSGTIDNDMCALEAMHQRLSQTFTNEGLAAASSSNNDSGSGGAAKKWVTRYVDYTSKYGLGFLLNDGSAGVYFNDSTKIVLAPTGDDFEYVERRKTEVGDRRGDHVRESHTLTTYPGTLQKKVILLKHFRNYLVEQHKKSEINEEGGIGGGIGMEGGKAIIVGGAGGIGGGAVLGNDAFDGELVYLKKWVRTRHAILFRLSNRTVQVVFFDHTEVLLSSEARSVTYVDKNRIRSTYELQEVMGGGGRADIAKRVKYVKDILYQLITGARR